MLNPRAKRLVLKRVILHEACLVIFYDDISA